MLSALATIIGLAAAGCTTLANLPQLIKAWTSRETDDLSLKTSCCWGPDFVPWIANGLLHQDLVTILANGASLLLLAALIYENYFGGRDGRR